MARLDANSRLRKQKAGLTTIAAIATLLLLVSVMGSVVFIWGNSFNDKGRTAGDYYLNNMNRVKERLIIEDLWLSKDPGYVAVLSLRNVGNIGMNVAEVKINVLDSNRAPVGCTGSPSCTRFAYKPFDPTSSTGLISGGQTLLISVDNIYWNHTSSKFLEVFVTTDRGSIIWKVYDWKSELPQVYTCYGLPATIVGTNGSEDLPGTSGDDIIALRAGDDSSNGSTGNDIICGGDGNDSTISGGNGNDILLGGNGNDNIMGGNDNDTIDGGAGTDTCNGGGGTNIIINCEL